MKIYKTKSALKEYLASLKKADTSIGFVPTMGALHQGHLSLIKKSKQHNAITVVSIFVNPTQFDNQEDLAKYPKTIDQDIALLESVDCEVLFLPSVAEIYDDNITADAFNFDGLEHQMEGKFRDGHFDGVGTIVKSLFEIVTPNTAYFGEKDFQQLQIIKKLVKKYKIPVKVKGCTIFREEDGLAMSSRNSRLSEEYREVAPFIYRTLKKAKKKFGTKNAEQLTKWVDKKFKKHPLLVLEYFTIADEKTLETVKNKETNCQCRAFIAVFAGDIRLIDNIRLK
ncbi:pantoate--beta-alanine ligase [Tenacibaculum piscium]|uniref:pantoate--beta-alanine ligase n=1 Tax=Tenacibaculum piscium TaxID=1458515 RepID=UPI001F409B37|nr:pantoate--beta-alanine ligase [Tenacibaculum piscium]